MFKPFRLIRDRPLLEAYFNQRAFCFGILMFLFQGGLDIFSGFHIVLNPPGRWKAKEFVFLFEVFCFWVLRFLKVLMFLKCVFGVLFHDFYCLDVFSLLFLKCVRVFFSVKLVVRCTLVFFNGLFTFRSCLEFLNRALRNTSSHSSDRLLLLLESASLEDFNGVLQRGRA